MNVRINPKPAPSAADLAQWRMAAKTAGLSATLADCLASNCADVSMAANSPFLMAVKNLGEYVAAVITDPKAAETQADASIKAALASATTPEEALAAVMAEGSRWWKMAGGDDKPTQRAHIGDDWASPQALRSKLADAVAAQISMAAGGDYAPSIGRELGTDKIAHARAFCRMIGERPHSDASALQIWMGAMGPHTTGDFSDVTQNALQLLLNRQTKQGLVNLQRVAQPLPAPDYRARLMPVASGASTLQPVLEGGEVKGVTLDVNGEAIPEVQDQAGLITVTERALRDSRAYGLEAAIYRSLVESARERLRTILATAITANPTLADGVAVFHSSRGNVQASSTAISVASISAARTGLARLVDSRGVKRPVTPTILLVPPELQTSAEQVVASITAAQVSNVNPFSGKLEVIADPGLGATDYWYLLDGPGTTDGLAMCYLDDQPAPQVEVRDVFPNFGMAFRVRWALASTFIAPTWFRTKI